MSLFKPFRGSRTTLDIQPLHDGYAYFCTDDGSFHIDYTDAEGNLQRKQISEDFIKQLLNMINDTGYLDAGQIIEEGDEVNG